MEKEYFILSVDPESELVYTLSLFNQSAYIEQGVPEFYQKKCKDALEKMRYLRDPRELQTEARANPYETKPLIMYGSRECNKYRRRRLPLQILQGDSTNYPQFIINSSLSIAFAKQTSIGLEIDIIEYIQQIQNKNNTNTKIIQSTLILEVELVTGAQEVLKDVYRKIYKEYQVKLTPNKGEKYKLSLKVTGYREYLLGNLPMMCYERVRISLRNLQNMKVSLTEIPKSTPDNNFPPIIERNHSLVKEGIFSPIDYDQLRDIPIFMWYPPYPLNTESIRVRKSHLQTQLQIPRAFNSSFLLQFREERKQQVNNKIINLDSNISYSGECDIPFTIKICGVENLQHILKHFQKNATYNGFTPMQFITHQKHDENAEGDHHHKKKKKKNTETKKQSFKTFYHTQGKQQQNQTQDNIDPTNIYGNQANTSYIYSEFAKKVELDVVPYLLQLKVMLYHGNKPLTKHSVVQTGFYPFSYNQRLNEWVSFGRLLISQLPQEIRICFELRAYNEKQEDIILASSAFQLFDEFGKMRTGLQELNLWPFYKIDERMSCMEQNWYMYDDQENNIDISKLSTQTQIQQIIKKYLPRLYIQLEQFTLPVYYSLREENTMKQLGFSLMSKKANKLLNLLESTPSNSELANLYQLINKDSLSWNFTPEEKEILIKGREHYKTKASALPIFLQTVDWSQSELVAEAHRMLKIWEPMEPQEALCLLDANFPDEAVRLYAVERIKLMSDDELVLFMVELTQALMFETQHFSPLSDMLLERSLANPHFVGHELFWLLRSSLHVKPLVERFSLLIEQFVMLCGSYREELVEEVKLNEILGILALNMKKQKEENKNEFIQGQVNLMNQKQQRNAYLLALDSRLQANIFIEQKCKKLGSKKEPLWLTLQNDKIQEEKLGIIYKQGDDLRQDILTLQLIRVMDKIWLDNGLDLRMKPYRVLPTMDMSGMIEIVFNSLTVAEIQKERSGASGALQQQCIIEHLQEKNNTPELFEKARQNFMRSCAGYIVATFVLGIGDRHNDNYMVSNWGHLFHIDFGHFLGNFKSKFGVKRERTPFVFSQDMYCMIVYDDKDASKGYYQEFCDLCGQAYNLVRKSGNLFINMFLLMLSAGMPELSKPQDIQYLKNMLNLSMSDQEAKIHMKKLLQLSRSDKFRIFDNVVHNIKTGGSKTLCPLF